MSSSPKPPSDERASTAPEKKRKRGRPVSAEHALPWHKVLHDGPDHPKTYALARELGVSKPLYAWAYVSKMWCWVNRFRGDGELSRDDGVTMALYLDPTLDPNALVRALVKCGWLDDLGPILLVHKWEETQGGIITKRAKDRKRQEKHRHKRALKRAGNVTRDNGVMSRLGHALVTTLEGEGEGEREEEFKNHHQASSFASPAQTAVAPLAQRPVVVENEKGRVGESPTLVLVPDPPGPHEMLWETVLGRLREEGKRYALTWLGRLRAHSLEADCLTLAVYGDCHFRDWVDDHYRELITEMASRIEGRPISLAYDLRATAVPSPDATLEPTSANLLVLINELREEKGLTKWESCAAWEAWFPDAMARVSWERVLMELTKWHHDTTGNWASARWPMGKWLTRTWEFRCGLKA